MRTDEQIIAHITKLEDSDFLGFIRIDLLAYLPFEAAKQFLKEEATGDDWKVLPRDRESIVAQIKDYMSFAWGKANDCRGLSAGRSLNHMQAWLWMLGEEDAAKSLDDYELYGKPQLRAICEHFGWDWSQWDDGHWKNNEDGYGAPPDAIPPVVLSWAA